MVDNVNFSGAEKNPLLGKNFEKISQDLEKAKTNAELSEGLSGKRPNLTPERKELSEKIDAAEKEYLELMRQYSAATSETDQQALKKEMRHVMREQRHLQREFYGTNNPAVKSDATENAKRHEIRLKHREERQKMREEQQSGINGSNNIFE